MDIFYKIKQRTVKTFGAGLIFLSCFLLSFNNGSERVIDDFKLLNVDGKLMGLESVPDAKGYIIVFTCNHCPFAKLYPPRLNALNLKYKPKGVPLLAISSTDTVMYEEDSFSKMVAKANHEQFNFPYLFDSEQLVAKKFKAQKTPHAYVIWKENNTWVIKYNGALDDNGFEPSKVKDSFVDNAVDALLNKKEVIIKETKSIGCRIYFTK